MYHKATNPEEFPNPCDSDLSFPALFLQISLTKVRVYQYCYAIQTFSITLFGLNTKGLNNS